jgi:rare lipoprotein A
MTANGEAFDPNGLNAAHKYLPLPTFVRVTNLENNRRTILRVNDRGPFVKGRIIDLSAGAAKKLGFYKKGTARVRVETVNLEG